MRYLRRYLVTLGLLAVFVLVFRYNNPTTAWGFWQAFSLLALNIQIALGIAFVVLFALVGGRWKTNTVLILACVWFLPLIKHPAFQQWVWWVATVTAGNEGPAAAEVYRGIYPWASYAVYAVFTLALLSLFHMIVRGVFGRAKGGKPAK